MSDYIYFHGTSSIMRFYLGNNEEMRLNTGGLHVNDNITAYSTTISSDIKLKDNVERIVNPLNILEGMHGVTWDWKRDGAVGAGVIAQDVQTVMPSAVKPMDSFDEEGEPYLTVDYNQIIGLLVASVKELKAEVDKLKGE